MSGWFTTEDGRKFSPEQRKSSAAKTKAAIARGEIPAASTCNRCRQTQGYVSYHNHDYVDPVKFLEALCWRCHAIWHSKHFAPRQVEAYFEAVKRGKRWPPLARPGWGTLAKDHGIVHPRDRGKIRVTGDCTACRQDKGVMRYWFGERDDEDPRMLCWWCWAMAWMNVEKQPGVLKYKAEILAGERHLPAFKPEWELMQKEYGIPTGQRGPQLAVDNTDPERGLLYMR